MERKQPERVWMRVFDCEGLAQRTQRIPAQRLPPSTRSAEESGPADRWISTDHDGNDDGDDDATLVHVAAST
eukprot:3436999-Rhodomonas_salina.1